MEAGELPPWPELLQADHSTSHQHAPYSCLLATLLRSCLPDFWLLPLCFTILHVTDILSRRIDRVGPTYSRLPPIQRVTYQVPPATLVVHRTYTSNPHVLQEPFLFPFEFPSQYRYPFWKSLFLNALYVNGSLSTGTI